uniref:RNA binding motif protein 20 n=1 Tax=Leptobrachium leishanense TaxID=445787 RepID=A0A8C5R4P2_9ANUR
GVANSLLASPASLQLAQLQAHLTLQRLKFAQTAVTSNTAAASVLNQVLSKVAMSQPLFNPLRNATMISAHGVSSLGTAMHNARFPSSGVPFSTQNQAMAPKHAVNPSQNPMPTFGRGMGGKKPGAFYGGPKAFNAENDKTHYHDFTGGATSSSSTANGQYGPKHDHPPGYKKDYFDTQGQHQSMGQKSDLGQVPHGNAPNNQWESSHVWQSPSQHYESRNELYNPEEPTPDTKFSPSSSPAFSRHNNMKVTNCVTNVKALQPHELNDFHGIPPLHLPHTCTMCDKKVFNLKDWELHVKGRMHIQKVMGKHIFTALKSGGHSWFYLLITECIEREYIHRGLCCSNIIPWVCSQFTQRKSSVGRVVHICNLPEGSCNENDVVNLGLPFGKVTNYILMKSTNQAFVEMAYTEAAEAMVQYYQEKPAMINDEKLLIRMSKRYKELQLKKPGKTVDAIIHDLHSQRERDLFRDTDRYRNERTRSRSPVSRSLSPRSHTPSYTSCSSTHSPLGATRTEWGNGRETWDQSAYGRWEDERDQSTWRDGADEKRDRTDHWVHDRKHYSRQLEKLELEDRTDGSRGHRDKYGNSHSARYKGREGEYYRKESKSKPEGRPQDTASKSKRKEEGKTRDVKGNQSEDDKKEISETKTNRDFDNQTEMDKNKKANSPDEAQQKDSVIDSKDNDAVRVAGKQVALVTRGRSRHRFRGHSTSFTGVRFKEEDWESESETWYPTNMEELVTVDEVGEEDLIIEPDITELEEIVSMETKESNSCIQMCPHRMSTLDLECRSNQSTGSECSSPREASIAMSCTSLPETASPASSCCGHVTKVPEGWHIKKSLEVPEYGSKGLNSSPSWEQDDVFTDLSIPLGVEFVVPRTGFYCKLCGLFYTSEEVAKASHCRSRIHYKNLQVYIFYQWMQSMRDTEIN